MSHILLTGVVGDHVRTGDSPDFDIVADLEVVTLVAPDVWLPVGSGVKRLFTRWYGGFETFEVGLANSAGSVVPRLAWFDASSVFNFATVFTDIGATDTEHMWLKWTLDVDNGSGQHVTTVYKSLDPIDTLPGAVGWTQVGSPVVDAGVTSIRNTSSGMECGSLNAGVSSLWAGKFYYANAKAGIGGTIKADPDFRDGDQTSDGGATFVDSGGHTWTVYGNASWVDDTDSKFVGRTIDMNLETGVVTIQSGV